MSLKSVRIVGSGLIGTSLGLALSQAGKSCLMIDSDVRAQELSQDLVGPFSGGSIDLVIFALPTKALADVVEREFVLNPQAGFIDIGSVKTKPKSIVDGSVIPLPRFCLTHPMAGREIGGADSAQGDLFQGRPWIVDPRGVDADVLNMVEELISICGSAKIVMTVEEHDSAVALISHLPQIASSLLAQQLESASEGALEISGAGLRDTTRIAASNPELWSDIITSNSQALKPLLKKMYEDLGKFISTIDNSESVKKFIAAGQVGRLRIPGKHGGKQRTYTYVPIVIDDKPGQLSLIFDECAEMSVNVEDLSIEHSPGQDRGLVTLAMSQDEAEKLSAHLTRKGWSVHPWRS